jgi:hypothetical protein
VDRELVDAEAAQGAELFDVGLRRAREADTVHDLVRDEAGGRLPALARYHG